MILVIADDLSGAAELAGVAARHGLQAEVHTTLDLNSNADVIAVDTDTRARPAAEAARIVADVTRAALALKPEWIYKKTDSVLRGHIAAEINAIIGVTGHARALFIPANPSRQRLIRDGIYYVAGVPLAETTFARDHDHPRRSSNVGELLGPNAREFNLLTPDATCAADIATLAREVNAATLPAGAVDFFVALLKMKFTPDAHDSLPQPGQGRDGSPSRPRTPRRGVPTQSPADLRHGSGDADVARPDFTAFQAPEFPGAKTLFVCGSAAAWDGGRVDECAAHDIPIFAMPEEIFQGDSAAAAMTGWVATVAAALHEHGCAMLAIGRSSAHPGKRPPHELTTRLVDAAAAILNAQTVDRIYLEGGATAAALLRRRGWTRLEALPADLSGVGILCPYDGPLLFIKPGSYPWPAAIWPE